MEQFLQQYAVKVSTTVQEAEELDGEELEQRLCSLFSKKDALRRGGGIPPCCQAQSGNKSVIDFVKAGIGGFHTALKQLAGKACTGVLISNVVFHREPLKRQPDGNWKYLAVATDPEQPTELETQICRKTAWKSL